MAEQPERLRIGRTLKIGTFHIGSAFADMLTSAVWNRILISNLGIPATPVALLSALRYLLAPLSIWAGHRSDTHPIFGLYRLPYIWLGRLLMLITLPLIPLVTIMLAADHASVAGWALACVAFLIYGVGGLLSGSTLLALIRDSAPPTKRGMALSIIQIFLVVSFPIAAIVYGRMMPNYDIGTFWTIIWVGTGIAALFWFFALVGEERPKPQPTTDEVIAEPIPFTVLLRTMWADQSARLFFLFLALASISAFAQDAILEPFGGDVFGLDVGETTRFNSYWGAGIILSMLITIFFTHRRAAHEQTNTAIIGLVCTALPLLLLAWVSLSGTQALLIPTLILFGLGYGIYTVGGIALLMAMTSDQRAGAYLGLWSVAQLLFRGVGIAAGGIIRDIVLSITGVHASAYAAVFALEAVGLLVCIYLLIRVDVPRFASRQPIAAPSPLAALAD